MRLSIYEHYLFKHKSWLFKWLKSQHYLWLSEHYLWLSDWMFSLPRSPPGVAWACQGEGVDGPERRTWPGRGRWPGAARSCQGLQAPSWQSLRGAPTWSPAEEEEEEEGSLGTSLAGVRTSVTSPEEPRHRDLAQTGFDWHTSASPQNVPGDA